MNVNQLSMPAGFSSDGTHMVTLRDLISPEVQTLDFPQLTAEKRAELTVARIKQQPDFEVGMIGAGMIDKNRAIEEVRNQTAIGKTLMEIEQRTIARAVRSFSGKHAAEQSTESTY